MSPTAALPTLPTLCTVPAPLLPCARCFQKPSLANRLSLACRRADAGVGAGCHCQVPGHHWHGKRRQITMLIEDFHWCRVPAAPRRQPEPQGRPQTAARAGADRRSRRAVPGRAPAGAVASTRACPGARRPASGARSAGPAQRRAPRLPAQIEMLKQIIRKVLVACASAGPG